MNTNIILDHKTCGELLERTDDAILSYMALKSLYNKQMEIQLLNIKSIIYQIDKNIVDKKRNDYRALFKGFEDGIKELDANGYINIINHTKDFYEIDMSNLFVENVTKQIEDSEKNKKDVSYFTIFDIDDIRNIYLETGTKKIFRFLFYILYRKHVNNEFFYFMKTREEIVVETGLNIKTIDKYTEILEDNYIIYVFRNPYKWKDSHKQLPNCYGLKQDESDIEKFEYAYIRKHKNDIYESAIVKPDKTTVSAEHLVTIEPIVKDVTQAIIIEEKPKGYVIDLETHKKLDEQIMKKKEQDLFADEEMEYYPQPVIEEKPKWTPQPKRNPFD